MSSEQDDFQVVQWRTLKIHGVSPYALAPSSFRLTANTYGKVSVLTTNHGMYLDLENMVSIRDALSRLIEERQP